MVSSLYLIRELLRDLETPGVREFKLLRWARKVAGVHHESLDLLDVLLSLARVIGNWKSVNEMVLMGAPGQSGGLAAGGASESRFERRCRRSCTAQENNLSSQRYGL